MTYKTGFTLIELLVIMFIIGLLATIALPGFEQFQDKKITPNGDPMIGVTPEGNEADLFLAKLPIGRIAFNSPATMELGEGKTLHLVLSLNKTIEELSQAIKSSGNVEGADVKVADSMEARLSGQGFRILAVTPETQAIAKKQTTEWTWEVEARVVGTQNLHLTLSTTVFVHGAKKPLVLRTFDKTIEVKVKWTERAKSFFNDNWKWLVVTIVIPLAGWWWKMRKRAKKPKTKKTKAKLH